MKFELTSIYSNALAMQMQIGIYGHSGKILLAFAPQDGKWNNFADFGMVEQLSPWIEQGKLMVVCPDSVDELSWSNKSADQRYRSYIQEQFFFFIQNELVPYLRARFFYEGKMMTTGCSMGGFHAANTALRRPDIFDSCIAMSGFYKSDLFFGDYMDDMLYNNSPVDYIANMANDHPYISMYNSNNFVIVSGRGAWEDDLLVSNYQLNRICQSKGINIWFDYWGYDVNHDWPWWKKQIVYHMQKMIPLD